jgi:hypothetical protein
VLPTLKANAMIVTLPTGYLISLKCKENNLFIACMWYGAVANVPGLDVDRQFHYSISIIRVEKEEKKYVQKQIKIECF